MSEGCKVTLRERLTGREYSPEYEQASFSWPLDDSGVWSISNLADCDDFFCEIDEWAWDVRVVADGKTIFVGPVDSLSMYPQRNLSGPSILGWLDENEASTDKAFSGTDLSSIAAWAISDGWPEFAGPNPLEVLPAGLTGSREISAGDSLSNVVRELGRTGIDFYQWGESIHVGPPNLGETLGPFTEKSFDSSFSLQRSAIGIVNRVTVRAGNGIIAVAEDIESIAIHGPHSDVNFEDRILDQASANANAQSALAENSRPRIEVGAGRLDPSLGLSICDFRPGRPVSFKFAEHCGLAGLHRITDLSLDKGPQGEKISFVLSPLGPELDNNCEL